MSQQPAAVEPLDPQKVVEIYQQVCDEWVGKKWWFTAYNVSKEVQKRGGLGVPRHAVAGKNVHPCMTQHMGSGEFTRTLAEVGQPVMPWLYHPTGADVSKYGQGGNTAAGPAIMPGDPAQAQAAQAGTGVPDPLVMTSDPNVDPANPPPVPAAAGKPAASSSRSVDSTGRLNIQPFLVQAAGFQPGEKAYAYDEDPTGQTAKPCMVLVKEEIVGKKPVTDYQVAADGRLRVTQAMLQICGLDEKDVAVDGGDNRLVIHKQ